MTGLDRASYRGELKRIYESSRSGLFRTALAVTRCAALAEDAVHEAFRKLLSTERRIEDLRVYVYRAVRNAAVDVASRDARERVEPSWTADETLDGAAGPWERASRREESTALIGALFALPEDERSVVALRVYGELTFREIAVALDVPEATASSRYYRALRHLRSKLKEPLWKT